MHFFWQKAKISIEEHGFFYVLIAITSIFFLWPLIHKSNTMHLFLGGIFFLIIFASARTLGKANVFAFFISFLFILIQESIYLLQALYPNLQTIFSHVLVGTVILYSLGLELVILKHILRSSRINVNDVYGAVCLYVLFALTWGVIYFFIATIDHKAFSIAPDPIKPFITAPRYIYSSFFILAGIYGDVHPISFTARLFTLVEVVIGQLFPLVLISWLVSHLRDLHSHPHT